MVNAQYNGVNDKDIADAIRKRGFGISTKVGCAIAIALPAGKPRKMDGARRYEVVGGCSPSAYKRIKANAEDADQAARDIIAECQGKTYGQQAQDLTSQVDEWKRLKDGIESGVQKVLSEMGLDRESIAAMRAAKAAQPAKRGRPRKVKLAPPDEGVAV